MTARRGGGPTAALDPAGPEPTDPGGPGTVPSGSGRRILAARGDGSPRSGQEAASGRLAAATDDDTTTHRTTSGSPQLGIVVHPGSGVHPRAAGAHPSSPARQDGASGCETDTR